jgi:NAD(P)-dependent dehydrogenase (short-subunit alcohol dehydrogenase family)
MKGKHVLITGASGGVGLVTAREFLGVGASVSLHYNTNKNSLSPLQNEYPLQTILLQADVTNELQIEQLFSNANSKFGPVEILIVCHGIWPNEDVLIKDMDYSRWKNTISVNLDGTFLFTKHYMKSIKNLNSPSIVLIGSTAGKFGEAYHSDYSCSKSAMMYGFILSVKNEIVKLNPRARINTVSPGWIR